VGIAGPIRERRDVMTVTRGPFEKGKPTIDRTHTETEGLTLPRWIPLALVLVTCALAVVFVVSTIEQDAPGPTP
jgi:hypothetical protein